MCGRIATESETAYNRYTILARETRKVMRRALHFMRSPASADNRERKRTSVHFDFPILNAFVQSENELRKLFYTQFMFLASD